MVIGVAFVAGTFVFTDTINESFKDLFQRASKGVDVSVTAKSAVGSDDFAAPPTMPASLLARVKATDGVAAAVGQVSARHALRPARRAESLEARRADVLLDRAARFDPLDYKEGGPPKAAGEVTIDKGTADKHHLKLGDTVTVAGRARAPLQDRRASPRWQLHNLGGARLIALTLPEAQRMNGHDGYETSRSPPTGHLARGAEDRIKARRGRRG